MTRSLKIKIYIDSTIQKKKKNYDYLSIRTKAIWREQSLKLSVEPVGTWPLIPQTPNKGNENRTSTPGPTVLAEARAEKWFQ